MLFIVQLVW